jgi:signal transduction histidine kinase
MGPVRRTLLWTALVLVVGFAATALVAGWTAMSAPDAVRLAGIGAGVAGAAVLVAAPLLRALRRCSLAIQVGVLALVVVGAVALGVFIAAETMFISDHDLGAMQVILLAAATVGVAGAVVLGAQVAASAASLVEVTRSIGDPERGAATGVPPVVHERTDGPPELARLARELEDMEARLTASRRRERAVEESRRELVAWVSHDLRTPLAALRAMAEALEDGVVTDAGTVARYHQSMREETDRLAALVDDLFELSRTQAGALRLQLERVSLGDLVSDAIAGVAPVAAAKGVHLVGRVDGPPPEIVVSAPELLRALRNVLENAIRHTPADGSVMVEAGAVEPDAAYVSVVDAGGGVPEADLERIFDVAYQSDPARTAGGAGLGLAIARGFVEAHRGSITVRNENGGARFTVRLPRDPVT